MDTEKERAPRHWTHLRCEGSKGGGSGSAASFIKKGRGWRRRLCRRVVKGTVLKMDGPSAQGFLSLTAFQAEGCGIALWGRRAARVQKVQRVQPAFGRLVQRVAVSPSRAMSMKSAL